MTSSDSDILETIYAKALEAIAMGSTKDETLSWLDRQFSVYSGIGPNEIEREAQQALKDAEKQGVEREDIDDSWFQTKTGLSDERLRQRYGADPR